jgi:hypothetical protein
MLTNSKPDKPVPRIAGGPAFETLTGIAQFAFV